LRIENPDHVAAGASRERLELADAAGALVVALDAADTIEARDSLEKMAVHQMADGTRLHHANGRAGYRLATDSQMNAEPMRFSTPLSVRPRRPRDGPCHGRARP